MNATIKIWCRTQDAGWFRAQATSVDDNFHTDGLLNPDVVVGVIVVADYPTFCCALTQLPGDFYCFARVHYGYSQQQLQYAGVAHQHACGPYGTLLVPTDVTDDERVATSRFIDLRRQLNKSFFRPNASP